jgi:hypothetical protein
VIATVCSAVVLADTADNVPTPTLSVTICCAFEKGDWLMLVFVEAGPGFDM